MTTQVEAPPQRSRGTLHHRRSVERLDAEQLARLRQAFSEAMALDDQRGFWYFAGWHGLPFEWCEHWSPIFLPWHRAYLHYLELALQERVEGVTLPWWDWTIAEGLPAAYAEAEVDGAENPLAGRRYKVYGSTEMLEAPPREPGAAAETAPPQAPPLPYKPWWDWAMEPTSFAEFQNRIEAVHGAIHVWVGGIMGTTARAGYDPIFFAHHAMVDRAWWIWQQRNPGALPGAELLDQALAPNGMTVRETLDVHELGYEYAGGASHIDGNL